MKDTAKKVSARTVEKLPLLMLTLLLLVLWPLFHYIVWTSATDGRAEKQFWADYVAVNQQFADTIVAHYRPGDISKSKDGPLILEFGVF
jgi:hypothetical protein